MTKAVLGEQGLITEAGYKEQAQSYRTMADAAGMAAKAEHTAASGAWITAGIKGLAALASIAFAVPTGGTSLVVGPAVGEAAAAAAGGGAP